MKELFRHILETDSTSGKERELALWLYGNLEAPSKELMEVGDGTLNLHLKWPSAPTEEAPEGVTTVFCTHMDTVPPYIPPTFTDLGVKGRGACDAKGQIISMYTACKELEREGKSGFALLLLSGEETGSWGAKAFSKTGFKAPYLIVGEPTGNRMVSASKGTKSFHLVFHGIECHSGYPENGRSAVDMFTDFCILLGEQSWGTDPVLGETTWNIGLLESPNPQNVLSPRLSCRLYFRTTEVSDARVCAFMESLPKEIEVSPRGGDTPAKYHVFPGMDSAPVAFGSDAPHLTGFLHKSVCGPGSILCAHRPEEEVLWEDIHKAVSLYKEMFNGTL